MTPPLRRPADTRDLARRQVLNIAAGAALVGTAVSAGIGAATPASADPKQATAPGAATGSDAGAPVPPPTPVALDALYDNDGIDTASDHTGDFDGSGYTFPGEVLAAGPITLGGVPYVLGSSASGAKNNVVALGQQIALPPGRYLSALLLVAGSYGASSGNATVDYSDGSSALVPVTAPDWYSAGGALTAPYRYTPSGTQDANPVSLWSCEARPCR
jgi:alpha-L-fucosidase